MAAAFTRRNLSLAPFASPLSEKHYIITVEGIDVSVMKFKEEFYDGQWEIFSHNVLFEDTYRYETLDEALLGITELAALYIIKREGK